jgi:hypothetical protein
MKNWENTSTTAPALDDAGDPSDPFRPEGDGWRMVGCVLVRGVVFLEPESPGQESVRCERDEVIWYWEREIP